jgi:hypothetical protein
MGRARRAVDLRATMNVLRHAAAGLVGLVAVALAVSAIAAFAAGALFWIATLYGAVAVGLLAGARRLRPRRHRYVFARR